MLTMKNLPLSRVAVSQSTVVSDFWLLFKKFGDKLELSVADMLLYIMRDKLGSIFQLKCGCDTRFEMEDNVGDLFQEF